MHAPRSVSLDAGPCNQPCNPTRLNRRLPSGWTATPWDSIPDLSWPNSMRGIPLDIHFESGSHVFSQAVEKLESTSSQVMAFAAPRRAGRRCPVSLWHQSSPDDGGVARNSCFCACRLWEGLAHRRTGTQARGGHLASDHLRDCRQGAVPRWAEGRDAQGPERRCTVEHDRVLVISVTVLPPLPGASQSVFEAPLSSARRTRRPMLVRLHRRARAYRHWPEQSSTRSAWIHYTSREAHRASCDDWLNPPRRIAGTWGRQLWSAKVTDTALG